jgi:hypothetical protein
MSDHNSEQSGDLQKAVILHPAYNKEFNIAKANRILFYAVITLISVAMLLGFFLMSTHNALTQFEKQQAIAEIQKQQINPALTEEINALKAQLLGLISGSIESKIKVLEESILLGGVTATTGMGAAIQDLKNDVTVLKTYSKTGAGRLIASNTQIIGPKQDAQLIDEIANLKNLFYISIASCGLLAVAIGGIWYQSKTQYWLRHDFNGETKTTKHFLGKQ